MRITDSMTIVIHCRECGSTTMWNRTPWYRRKDGKFTPATTLLNAETPRMAWTQTLTQCAQHREGR